MQCCVKGGVVGAGGQLVAGARVPSALSGCWQPRDPVQSHPKFVDVQSLHHSTAREHRLRCLCQCLHRRRGAFAKIPTVIIIIIIISITSHGLNARDVKFSRPTWSRGQILRSRSRSRSHDIVLVLMHVGLVASTTHKLISD